MIRSASFPFAENACDEGGRKKFAVLETKRGIEVEEIGRFFEASAREPGQKPLRVAGSHRVHEREAERAPGGHGAQEETAERSLGGRRQQQVLQWRS